MRLRIRRRLALTASALLTVALLLGATPGPAAAADMTPGEVGAQILGWLNADRQALGLLPYARWDALDALATERAGLLAASGVLTHQVQGGSVGEALDAAGIPWLGYGEVLAMSGFPWGTEAATNVYSMWLASDPHRAILQSPTYNYLGIGVAEAADGTTWVSAIMTESLDHTRPTARNGTTSRSGTTITYRWSGTDPPLQTHTAGVADYDVAYRVDGGRWRLLRDNTTARSIRLTHRAHRHHYSFRVRCKDRRGNLSPWTTEVRIWVP